MKALFSNYFNVSVAGCVLILFVILARVLLKGAPKRMICILWGLVFLRLLLPVGLESSFSLRPAVPAVTEQSTGIYFESKLLPEEQIPQLIPRTRESLSFGSWTARVDYVKLASWVWGAGCLCLLLYAAMAYGVLRLRLRRAVRLRERIYMSDVCCGGLLLGYFSPRIYLSSALDEKTGELVIRHEKAHQKWGDHWLKLAAYVCLGLHWYNPLVWAAYLLLSRDLEYACDASVVKDLALEERKAYSAALLSVGKQHSKIAGAVLPFGQGSLRRRITGVLQYRKPALWICVAAAVAIVVFGIFFVTDPAPEYPPMCEELTELLGQSKDTVTRELDIRLVETDLTAITGYYDTDSTVEYQGVKFDLVLGFSLVDGKLWSFQYVTTYEKDRQQAAGDTVRIAKHLQSIYGKAAQSANKRTLWLSDINEAAVLEKFENRYLTHEGVSNVTGNWQLSRFIGQETRDYWEETTRSEFWKKHWEGRPVTLDFSLDMSAWNDPDTDTICLCLDYGTRYSFEQIHTLQD